MSDPGARTAVAQGLASMIGVPTDWVNVVLQLISRRLLTARILQGNGNVRMSYTITIPDTLQSTGILTNVTSTLTNARPADVTASISAALTQSVGAGAYSVVVSQMSTPVISTSATTSAAHSRGAIPPTAQSEEDGDSRNTGLAVIITIFVILLVCACCGIVIVLVYVYRKRGEQEGVVYEIGQPGQHDASELRAAASPQNEHYPQVHVAQVGSPGAWAEPRQ